MKLSTILLFAILGHALAIFPDIPEYEQTTQIEEDGLSSSTPNSLIDAESSSSYIKTAVDVKSDVRLARQARSSIIPVYIIKSNTDQESTKKDSAVNAVKEPTKTEEFKHFGPYGSILMRQFQNLNGQGYVPPQPVYGTIVPIYGSFRPIFRPSRPIYSTGPSGYGFGYRPNYELRPNNVPTFVAPTYDISSRDFYGFGYDD